MLALGRSGGGASVPFLGVLTQNPRCAGAHNTRDPGLRPPRPSRWRARASPRSAASNTQNSTGHRAPPEAPGARAAAKPKVGGAAAREAQARTRPRLRPLRPRKMGWAGAARPAGGRGHSPHHAVGALADVREIGVARPHVEHLPADHLRARARRRRRRHVGCRAAAAASAALG